MCKFAKRTLYFFSHVFHVVCQLGDCVVPSVGRLVAPPSCVSRTIIILTWCRRIVNFVQHSSTPRKLGVYFGDATWIPLCSTSRVLIVIQNYRLMFRAFIWYSKARTSFGGADRGRSSLHNGLVESYVELHIWVLLLYCEAPSLHIHKLLCVRRRWSCLIKMQ